MIKKVFEAEDGFTLVELLVTLAILGVLFGIVTLTLTGVGSDAQSTVCASETFLVQSAVDVWVAKNPLASIDLSPAAQITGTSPAVGAYTDYLRGTTTGTYLIAANIVSQTACP